VEGEKVVVVELFVWFSVRITSLGSTDRYNKYIHFNIHHLTEGLLLCNNILFLRISLANAV
jgi:hypothetical protein